MASVEFILNGKPIRVENPAPQMTLLEFIRSRGLTGAKEGCAEGECGACAVALVEPDRTAEGRSAYRAANSCLMFLPAAAGHEIYTVEGLAEGDAPHPVQAAMAEAGASQCGYCTPGFVVSLFAEHYRRGRSGPCDVRALTGNLCRCTGYRPIRDAAHSLGAAPDDRFRQRLDQAPPRLAGFSTTGFSRPETLEECLALLERHPDAKIVAGATDVAVESNLRHRRWGHLVSVEAIAELSELSNTAACVRIGASMPLNEIGRRWNDAPAVLLKWLELFASPLIRNRATLGGNLATASPIGDAAPLLLALDAVIHVAKPGIRRTIPSSSFFAGYRKTALAPGELITAIEIPRPFPLGLQFYKVAKRRLDDISTVAAAIAIHRDAGGNVSQARFAFGGVAATPVRSVEAEEAVIGRPWNEDAVERVQQVLDRTLQPISDHRGSRGYRVEVTKRLIEKYYWEGRQ